MTADADRDECRREVAARGLTSADADRPALRGLRERALVDSDAWTRWKALRGLAVLGTEPSRDAVAPVAQDVDVRVRLEAAGALRELP